MSLTQGGGYQIVELFWPQRGPDSLNAQWMFRIADGVPEMVHKLFDSSIPNPYI